MEIKKWSLSFFCFFFQIQTSVSLEMNTFSYSLYLNNEFEPVVMIVNYSLWELKWQNLWCSIFGIHILRLLVLIPVPHSEPHESVMTDVFLWSHRDTIFLRSVLDNATKQCFHVSAQHETFCQQGNKQKHPCLYMPHSKNIITRLIFLINQVKGHLVK